MTMNKFSNAWRAKGMALASCLMLLSACATSPRLSPEESVKERATTRWELFFSGDLAGAYAYLSPGYRSSVSSLQYQRSVLVKRVAWTSAEYIDSECEGTSCKVKFDVGFTISGVLPGVKSHKGTQRIEQNWVLIDGQWYLIPA